MTPNDVANAVGGVASFALGIIIVLGTLRVISDRVSLVLSILLGATMIVTIGVSRFSRSA